MHGLDSSQRVLKSVRMCLLAMLACMLPVAGHAQIVQNLVAGHQGRTIENALAEGKGVLVARKTIFNPLVGIHAGSAFGGDYRPPLTYWIRRGTQEQLVLGSSSSDEGRGKLLTNQYHFFIIEPGYYDLVGYVEKTSGMGASAFPKAIEPIRSAIGFVNFRRLHCPCCTRTRCGCARLAGTRSMATRSKAGIAQDTGNRKSV